MQENMFLKGFFSGELVIDQPHETYEPWEPSNNL